MCVLPVAQCPTRTRCDLRQARRGGVTPLLPFPGSLLTYPTRPFLLALDPPSRLSPVPTLPLVDSDRRQGERGEEAAGVRGVGADPQAASQDGHPQGSHADADPR